MSLILVLLTTLQAPRLASMTTTSESKRTDFRHH
jgi:hypothetical protein